MVDRLESLINKSWHIPLTSRIFLDEEELLDIVDQMRIVIPDEVKEASRIQQDKDRIVTRGQEEADRIISLAQEEAYRLIGESRIVEEAKIRSQEIVDKALEEAKGIRAGADDYAAEVLQRLDIHLSSLQATIHSGLQALGASQGEMEEEAIAEEEPDL